jgi:hypothetical protein
MKCSGAGNVEVRSDLKREYGLELLKSGMVALLCPNCHWGYDHGSSTIRPEALQERAKLLFQQNHGLGKEMTNTEVCLLVEEGFGRPQFRELCKEVKEAEGLTPVELNYTVPCSKQERALATLAQEKGVEDVKCEAPGCNAVDCLQIHGDTVRHAQLYNRLVQLLPSKKIVFVKKTERPLRLTTLVWKEDGSLVEGMPINTDKAWGLFYGEGLEFEGLKSCSPGQQRTFDARAAKNDGNPLPAPQLGSRALHGSKERGEGNPLLRPTRQRLGMQG